MPTPKLLILDTEVNHKGNIECVGLIDEEGNNLYKGDNMSAMLPYLRHWDILVGHNILKHDLQFLLQAKEIPISIYQKPIIDTLWLSSLIFIRYPYHALIKDYKLDKTNDPIQDAKLCLELLKQCESEFLSFAPELQNLLFTLLEKTPQFQTFFEYLIQKGVFNPQIIEIKAELRQRFSSLVQEAFFDEVCDHFISECKLELAYVLRLLLVKMQFDRDISILPAWIIQNLPKVNDILHAFLQYKIYDAKRELKRYFWYDEFRSFETADGKKVSQQEVVEATLKGEDILAIFSTGGGKSLTFQLPALMIAEQLPYLTLVISPLQSLMKDQVDVLNHRFNITNVGYLNSTLNPLERKEVNQKVEFGGIDLLYLSPEMLRSQSTIRLLSKRLIARIVIDEAHCFSKWGHDFRIDYMFIADFIKELSKKNKSLTTVKISCFTATGKRDVTEEIKSYFKNKLWNELREFRSTSARSNLHYEVLESHTETERFNQLLELLENRVQSQPCIIFTRYTGADSDNEHGAKNLADKINEIMGYKFCAHYHGKMKSEEKRSIQDNFINGTISTIVATNAFWMGVDKNNVRFVIHYGIPSSIENYLQEAGRAGRDSQDSTCIILYNSEDINANLQLNKSGEVKQKEILSLWSTIKRNFWKFHSSQQVLVKSPKMLIKDAGWLWNVDFDNQYRSTKAQQETKLKTALFFLEKFWFIKREFNRTKVRATANKNLTLSEQFIKIDQIFQSMLPKSELEKLKEIYKLIKSSQVIAIEDINIGLPLYDDEKGRGVQSLVNLLRGEKFIEKDDEISLILNPTKDITSLEKLDRIDKIWTTFFDLIQTNIFQGSEIYFDKVKLNTEISKKLNTGTIAHQIDLLFLLFKKRKKIQISGNTMLFLCDFLELKQDFFWLVKDAQDFLSFLLESNYSKSQKENKDLLFVRNLRLLSEAFSQYLQKDYSLVDLELLLKFLHLFEIIRIEGGLFLYQTKFQLKRGENPPQRFTKEHYTDLESFYQKKTEQAHIMDEFAKRLQQGRWIDHFVEDYFGNEYSDFLSKYFKNRKEELHRPLSKEKYQKLYHSLSEEQQSILKEKDNVLIIAGPWAGKTKSLVHKVASLILEDGIRKEEFLLLTFSRSAKFELKKRIIDLIGPQGYFLQIDTFHSYALKLLQKEPIPELFEETKSSIIKQTIKYLKENPALQLPYSILILDEFQDINDEQFELVTQIKAHSSNGDEMKAIAAGDDDQSIFSFTGGNIKHIQQFKNLFNAKEIILTSNYRSTQELVDFTSKFIQLNSNRIKENTQFISKVKQQKNSLFEKEGSKIQVINLAQDQTLNYLPEFLNSPFLQKQIKSWSSTAILFHNNETWLLIDNILKKEGYKTTLLLQENGYKLEQTLEFSSFIKSCEDEQNPVTKDNINSKLEKIIAIYWDNKNTKLLSILVSHLVQENAFLSPRILRDAICWISEQELLRSEFGNIILSTFHKAKGLEFDNVIICFDQDIARWNQRNQTKNKKEELIRLLYVAMTRAKNNLSLLWNTQTNPFLNYLSKYSLEYISPHSEVKNKKEIWLITSCSDINLWYHDLLYVHPSDAFPLETKVKYTFNPDGRVDFMQDGIVLQSSSKLFSQKLKKWISKNYSIKTIHIHQRLWYYLKEQKKSILVYLFKIILQKDMTG